jgi:hypothetical protein
MAFMNRRIRYENGRVRGWLWTREPADGETVLKGDHPVFMEMSNMGGDPVLVDKYGNKQYSRRRGLAPILDPALPSPEQVALVRERERIAHLRKNELVLFEQLRSGTMTDEFRKLCEEMDAIR